MCSSWNNFFPQHLNIQGKHTKENAISAMDETRRYFLMILIRYWYSLFVNKFHDLAASLYFLRNRVSATPAVFGKLGIEIKKIKLILFLVKKVFYLQLCSTKKVWRNFVFYSIFYRSYFAHTWLVFYLMSSYTFSSAQILCPIFLQQ